MPMRHVEAEPVVGAIGRTETDELRAYMSRFAGYGDMSARLWFVGMEEGGGRDEDELMRRVSTWSDRGQNRLEDLADYHRAIGMPRHFDPPFPLQRTWGPLARLLQAWRGEATDHATLRHVQATELGAHGGSATLVELLPLPAAGTSAWPYASLGARFPELCSRMQYRAATESARIAMLRDLIREGKSQAVICYGLGYRTAWTELAGTTLQPSMVSGRTCYFGETTDALFAAVPHPVAHGGTSRFWEDLGAHVAARVRSRSR